MSVARLMTQPLTVQAMGPATQDVYGDWIPGALGDPVAVLGYLEQTTSVEFTVNRDTTVTTWVAYLPAGTPVTARSTITYQAQTFQVDGSPWQVFNPRTRATDHIECRVIVSG